MEEKQSQILDRIPPHQSAGYSREEPPNDLEKGLCPTVNSLKLLRTLQKSSFTLSTDDTVFGWMGVTMVLSRSSDDSRSTYCVSLRSIVPGQHAFVAVMIVRRYFASLLGISIRTNMTLQNIVPESSDIVRACSEGNVSWVKELFATRSASPNDITPVNLTLLRVSCPCSMRDDGAVTKVRGSMPL
jgi:hypothetical protein